MKKTTLLYAFILIGLIANAQSPKYIIDFEKDEPLFNFVNDQVAEVTGNVLMNNSEKTEAGFGYKITMTISGGPEGSTPINYLTRDNSGPAPATGASKFDTGGTKIREQFGGAAALSFAFLGRESNNGDYTYLRDPSSNLRFTFELDNGEDLENVTYILGDMDYALENTNPSSTCFGPTDNNDYRCRSTYIDQITVISGAGSNEYTFANPSRIYQVGINNVRGNSTASSRRRTGDTFYANFLDANNDQQIDSEDDGKIPGTDGDGNITVYNSGNIGSQIIFDYNDPGYGLASDPDGYHDFDSYNQVMSFMTGMTFGSCTPTLSQVEADILQGEQACIIVSGATSYSVSPTTGVNQDGENLCLSPTETTIYTITSTDAGCTETTQIEVNVCPQPTLSLSQVEADIFQEDQACITVSGAANYSVSPTIGVSQSGENLCLSPTETTIYTITSIKDGCTETAQFELRVWSETSIPTMSQWGLLIFGLLILNLAIIFVYQQEQILAGVSVKN